MGIPAEAYVMKEEVDIDGQLIKTFEKLPTVIRASLPEQIGVEYLLRDIDEVSNSTLVKQANDKVTSIKALISRLSDIRKYLVNVLNKKLIPNPLIISNIQELFNYLPNYETDDIVKSLSNQTNDNYLLLYLNWLVKTTIGLHKLINNKITLKEAEVKKDEKKDEKKEEKKEDKPAIASTTK